MHKFKKTLIRWENFLVLVIVLEVAVFGTISPKFLHIGRLLDRKSVV